MIKPSKEFVHTLSNDNGREFSKHQMRAEPLNVQFYFTHPHCSRECGPNENTNNLIRQYFPKKISFYFIVKEPIIDVQN